MKRCRHLWALKFSHEPALPGHFRISSYDRPAFVVQLANSLRYSRTGRRSILIVRLATIRLRSEDMIEMLSVSTERCPIKNDIGFVLMPGCGSMT